MRFLWQPSGRLAPPETFIQRLARHAQQARGHALIAVGVPQRGGNQSVFGLFQGGEGLRGPRTAGRTAPRQTTTPRPGEGALPRWPP